MRTIQGGASGQTPDLVDFDLTTYDVCPILLGQQQIWQNWHSIWITYQKFENQSYQNLGSDLYSLVRTTKNHVMQKGWHRPTRSLDLGEFHKVAIVFKVEFDCSSAFLVADAEPHGEAAGDVVRHVAAEDHRGQVVRTLSPHGPEGKGKPVRSDAAFPKSKLSKKQSPSLPEVPHGPRGLAVVAVGAAAGDVLVGAVDLKFN